MLQQFKMFNDQAFCFVSLTIQQNLISKNLLMEYTQK